MRQYPQIERAIARPEDQPGYEREIWQPLWKCFCCQDTGVVRPHLVRLVIPDYNWNEDKLPLCKNPKCTNAPEPSQAIAHMFDCRLSAIICKQLDEDSREDWKTTIELKHDTLQQLANSKSLRQRERTVEEEEIAQGRGRIAQEEMEDA